ncbi:hypothetical protein F2Q69_00047251 [Brassica cretica]|uniref:Uncharacterized protein n=1 Tax=Brassica cretica TaxID=69181 RepID=A0A8S9PT56_BRACR|nr:hypothetical protein F2Q69_00047251 [Brassica cretica]
MPSEFSTAQQVKQADEGVNPEDSRVHPFITDMEGKTFTFQVRGGDDADDDDKPEGIPVPVQVETGEGSSDAVKDADEKADDPAPKKRIHSSTNAAKKARVV